MGKTYAMQDHVLVFTMESGKTFIVTGGDKEWIDISMRNPASTMEENGRGDVQVDVMNPGIGDVKITLQWGSDDTRILTTAYNLQRKREDSISGFKVKRVTNFEDTTIWEGETCTFTKPAPEKFGTNSSPKAWEMAVAKLYSTEEIAIPG